MPPSARPLYATPIKDRPPAPPTSYIQLVAFNAVFATSMIGLHVLQLCSLPLCLFPATVKWYERVCELAKAVFGQLLVFITMMWAPTTVRITVDEGEDELDLRKIVQRDSSGRVIGLDLPDRMVLMANHQVYCDWSYIWSLLYFSSLHSSLHIILKASLKWIPVVGPAMQMFRFIFMHRSWAADRVDLGRHLAKMGDRANRSLKPFVLLIFPEGTLVSPLTRPASKKFAENAGIPDGVHTLLPRSTGTIFCLRTLLARIPTLRLVDATIGYPGIPSGGYGQDYYTLQSIFSTSVPPPVIHMHLHSYSVKHDVPVGRDSLAAAYAPGKARPQVPPVETPEERKEFDAWLLQRWREKDERLQRLIDHGSFSDGPYVDVPLQLKSQRDLVVMLVAVSAGLWILKWLVKILWRIVVR